MQRRILETVYALNRCTAPLIACYCACSVVHAEAVLQRHAGLVQPVEASAGSGSVWWEVIDRARFLELLQDGQMEESAATVDDSAHGSREWPPAQAEARLRLAEQTLIACLEDDDACSRRLRAASALVLVRQYATAASGDPTAWHRPIDPRLLEPRARVAARMAELLRHEGTGARMPLELVTAAPADIDDCAGTSSDETLAVLVGGFGRLMRRQLRQTWVPTATGRSLLHSLGSRLASMRPETATTTLESVLDLLDHWWARHPADQSLVAKILTGVRVVDLRPLVLPYDSDEAGRELDLGPTAHLSGLTPEAMTSWQTS